MDIIVAVLLIIVGLVNAVPGLAAVVPGAPGRAYGVDVADRNVGVLLQHRAILLFLVGAALIASAFHEPLRVAAMIGAGASMLSYAVIVLAGQSNSQLRRVAFIDVGALVLLAVVAVLELV